MLKHPQRLPTGHETKFIVVNPVVSATWQACPICNGNGAPTGMAGWPAKTSDYCLLCEGKGGKWMITDQARRVPTDDDKRISGITLRTKRYILDARYTAHSDWWAHINAQDVQFLLAIIDQQQVALEHVQKELAELKGCIEDRAGA